MFKKDEKSEISQEMELKSPATSTQNHSFFSTTFNQLFSSVNSYTLTYKIKSKEELEKISEKKFKSIMQKFMTANWGTDTLRSHSKVTAIITIGNESKKVTHALPETAEKIVKLGINTNAAKKSWHEALIEAETILMDLGGAYFPSEANIFNSTETLELYNNTFDKIQKIYLSQLVTHPINEQWELIKVFAKILKSLETDHSKTRDKVIERIKLIRDLTSSSNEERHASLNYLSYFLKKIAKDEIPLFSRNSNILYNEIMKIRACIAETPIGITNIEVAGNNVVFKDNDIILKPQTIRKKGEDIQIDQIWLRRFELKYQNKLREEDFLFLKVNKPNIGPV